MIISAIYKFYNFYFLNFCLMYFCGIYVFGNCSCSELFWTALLVFICFFHIHIGLFCMTI